MRVDTNKTGVEPQQGMRKAQTLQQVTIKLANKFSQHCDLAEAEYHTLRDPVTEEEAYIAHDPLLARLHKDYLDACAQTDKLAKDLGVDDPMTSVSADMAESALSAFETRLIELKSDKTLRRRVGKMVSPEAQEEAIRRAKRLKRYKLAVEMNRMSQETIEKLRRAGEERFFFMMFMMEIFYAGLEQAKRQLTLAQSFSVASEGPSLRQVMTTATSSGTQ